KLKPRITLVLGRYIRLRSTSCPISSSLLQSFGSCLPSLRSGVSNLALPGRSLGRRLVCALKRPCSRDISNSRS
ncbi:hypothetical protein C0993_003911, partial [Termitomyces sp. T159_Od127]